MNGINRRGQKVICVLEIELAGAGGFVYPGPYPKENQAYTVADFIDNGALLITNNLGPDIAPAVVLVEIPCPQVRRRPGKLIGWLLACFRPAFEGKTDISVFAPAPVREMEPV